MTAMLQEGPERDAPEVAESLRKPFELAELAALLERRLPRH